MMFLTTPALVLHRAPYSDKYGIVHCYTASKGRINFLVPARSGVRHHRREPAQWTMLRPLDEVELTVELKPHRELHHIRELHLQHSRLSLNDGGVKTAVSMFLAELLYRILTHTEADEPLYRYVTQCLNQIEMEPLPRAAANSHLCFMLHLLPFLGVEPDVHTYNPGDWFDMREGRYAHSAPGHPDVLPPDEAAFLPLLMRMNMDNMGYFRFNRVQRLSILERLIRYYRLHLPPFPSLHSPDILRSLYDSRKTPDNNL